MSKEKQIDTPTLVPTQTNSPTDELMQIEEMAEVYYKARLKARETLGSMNEGEAMWYSKAFFEAGYRKQNEVVRCKDCEHFYQDGNIKLCRHWNCHSTEDDAYCGYAKIKGGAE